MTRVLCATCGAITSAPEIEGWKPYVPPALQPLLRAADPGDPALTAMRCASCAAAWWAKIQTELADSDSGHASA